MYRFGVKYRRMVWATIIYGLSYACLPQENKISSAPPRAVPIASVPVRTGKIELTRTYGATLEAPARFVVAPRVRGRIEQLHVDLGDLVRKNQVLAELDNDEYEQQVVQARADLAVARAKLSRASTALHVATRELSRIQTLRKRGINSEAQFDNAQAVQLQRQSEREVSEAEVARAKAQLDTARIRLGYTKIRANWNGKGEHRVVGKRFLSVGTMVAENTPLLSIVQLNPIVCVISVAERDYQYLKRGQQAVLTTDAYPQLAFQGHIERIAPVFEPGSRQARVELLVDNDKQLLKPGMFVRAKLGIRTVPDAVLIPGSAITTRQDQSGLFLVDEDAQRVKWQPISIGIQEGQNIEVLKPKHLFGRVVTVGHHLIDDGSLVSLPSSPVEQLTP